jgi:hypothetical protein
VRVVAFPARSDRQDAEDNPTMPPSFVTCAGQEHEGVSDASLMVIRLGSRDDTGEQLRSNRLEEGRDTSCTVPEEGDEIVYNMTLPYYSHPDGGCV